MRTKKGTEDSDKNDQRYRIAYVQGQVKCTRSLRGEKKRKEEGNKIKQKNDRGRL